MKKSDESIRLISYIFNGQAKPEIKNWDAVIEELERHAILSMALGHLNEFEIPNDIISSIEGYRDRCIFNYIRMLDAQQKIVDELESRNICFVVLKGTSAGQYYPYLSNRTYGDIDLLINEEDDFNKSVDAILNMGYLPMHDYADMRFTPNRYHIEFSRNGIEIELHPCFKKVNQELEPYIQSGEIKTITIGEWHFPAYTDLTNGLILLRHMRFHCPLSLGMRQVIDWVYYLKIVMTNEFWDAQFGVVAEEVGDKNFAIHITRMCELYFGIEEHKFAASADVKVCRDLFDIISANGNFGTNDVIARKTSAFMNANDKLKLLRRDGTKNKKITNKWSYMLGVKKAACIILKSKHRVRSVIAGMRNHRKWESIRKVVVM